MRNGRNLAAFAVQLTFGVLAYTTFATKRPEKSWCLPLTPQEILQHLVKICIIYIYVFLYVYVIYIYIYLFFAINNIHRKVPWFSTGTTFPFPSPKTFPKVLGALALASSIAVAQAAWLGLKSWPNPGVKSSDLHLGYQKPQFWEHFCEPKLRLLKLESSEENGGWRLRKMEVEGLDMSQPVWGY